MSNILFTKRELWKSTWICMISFSATGSPSGSFVQVVEPPACIDSVNSQEEYLPTADTVDGSTWFGSLVYRETRHPTSRIASRMKDDDGGGVDGWRHFASLFGSGSVQTLYLHGRRERLSGFIDTKNFKHVTPIGTHGKIRSWV